LPFQNHNFFISKYLKDKSDKNENNKTKRKGQEKREKMKRAKTKKEKRNRKKIDSCETRTPDLWLHVFGHGPNPPISKQRRKRKLEKRKKK